MARLNRENRPSGFLVPLYEQDGGNATRIYTATGQIHEDRRTMRWVLRKIARIYSVDLERLRHNVGANLAVSQGVPLPLAPELVLAPLKLRQAIGANDGSIGYVNISAIEKFSGHAATCRIFS